MRFLFQLCSGRFSTLNYNHLLKHDGTNHVNFRVKCDVNECKKIWSNVCAIKNHLKRFHPAFYLKNVAVVNKNILFENSVSNELSFCNDSEHSSIS